MDTTLTDDDVIARLRSALDDVAATSISTPTDGDVVRLRPAGDRRRPTRTWLGLAAASVALIGATVWLVTQRQEPRASTTPSTVPAAASTPWFRLALSDAEPGQFESTDVPDDGTTTVSWWVAEKGVVTVTISSGTAAAPPDPATATALPGAPEGSAWSLSAASNAATGQTVPAIMWQRADGTVWVAQEGGLFDLSNPDQVTAFATYVFALQPGPSNGDIVNPDPTAELVGVATRGGTTYSQTYLVGQDVVAQLSVLPVPALEALVASSNLGRVTVSGVQGWKGTSPEGVIDVVWPAAAGDSAADDSAGTGAWGFLRIGPSLAERVDEVIASVTPAPLPTVTPATVPTTTVDPNNSLPSSKPADAPTYVLDVPGLTAEVTNGITSVGSSEPRLRSFAGIVDQSDLGAAPAYVFAQALDWGGLPYDADGVNYLDVSRAGETALLDMGIDSSGNATLPKKVYLPQVDGMVWTVQAVNLVAAGDDPNGRLVDLAFALIGGGIDTGPLPASVSAVADGHPAVTQYDDTFRVDGGGTVTVAVSDGTTVWEMRDATSITPLTVLERPALRAEFADGSVVITWQAAEGSTWWGALRFSDRAAAAVADQVIAGLQVTTPAP